MKKLTAAEMPITVLMSCYNAEQWLDEAINSVLQQSFKDFEFIIVDDGSCDKTLDIIEFYAKMDRRIVVIAKQNTGLADSLNVGINRARGEWIARIDADDLCEPTRLEKQITMANSNPKLVFLGTGQTTIDKYGKRLNVYRYPSIHNLLLKYLKNLRKFPPHSSAFYRTEVVRGIGGYRTKIVRAQDMDLWLRLSEVGELACVDEPLVRIREHSSQISYELGGRRQKIDSRTAIISYFLRQSGFCDPVEADGKNFETFRSWVERRLEEEGVFKFQHFKNQLKTTFYGTPNLMDGILKIIINALYRPAYALFFIQYRLIGEDLPYRLSQEWISQYKLGVK